MKTSIATVSISGDLAEKLAAIAAAGFDGVEIFENDFLAFDGSPQRCRRAWRATPASRSPSSNHSAISRGCRSRSATVLSIAPSASSTSCRNSAPT